MDITCQSCQQVLSIAGPTPSFCPFCGASLSKAGTAVKVAGALPETAVHEAETIPGSSAGALTEPQVSHAAPSQMVGDFRLLRELGQGGMGTVFEAEHQATGRRVALKLLSTRVQQSADSVERFLREARLAASLSHPRSTFVYGGR